jgi:hypothetical protein
MGAVVSTIGHTLRTIAQGLCCTSRVGADRGELARCGAGSRAAWFFGGDQPSMLAHPGAERTRDRPKRDR